MPHSLCVKVVLQESSKNNLKAFKHMLDLQSHYIILCIVLIDLYVAYLIEIRLGLVETQAN